MKTERAEFLEAAFRRGLADGYAEPHELSYGMTYDGDRAANEAYDSGVNLGQLEAGGTDPNNHLLAADPVSRLM